MADTARAKKVKKTISKGDNTTIDQWMKNWQTWGKRVRKDIRSLERRVKELEQA